MKPYTLIKNAKLVDCEKKTQSKTDILLKNSRDGSVYEAFDANIPQRDDYEIYDAGGKLAMPAFIDLHVHLRDPGFEYKEDIISGTLAAACGGFSGVCAMPNTKPVTDSPAVLDYVTGKAKSFGSCKVYPAAAITVGQRGEELCDYRTLTEHGAVAFTDDGHPVSRADVMLRAMRKCAADDYLIISHSEELSLSAGGVINEGTASAALGLAGIPNAAEDVAVARDIILAETAGCRLHIAHVSTAGSLELIRAAKARGVRVTCETCPHYFSLCDDDVVFYGSNAKMNPPLRSRKDVAAVIEAICDGTVDCISTDHAPHSAAEKSGPLTLALNGITGLQTSFPAAVTYLLMPGHIDVYRLIELMYKKPAEILGLDDGIGVGKAAHLNIVDINREVLISGNMLRSKSYNTPYLGSALYGAVEKNF